MSKKQIKIPKSDTVSKMDGFINAEDLSLEDWLKLLKEGTEEAMFVDYMFPTDRHKKEFFDTLATRSEDEIDLILHRFLWAPTTFGSDKSRLDFVRDKIKKDKDVKLNELDWRYILWDASQEKIPVWDGIRWVLDLLPRFPKPCLDVLSAFVSVYGLFLPDGRLFGVLDAMDLIRKKYITTDRKGNEYNTIDDREMEKLIYALYKAMGYEVQLTPQKRDGGCDVVIYFKKPGQKEKTLIEVKHHNKPIGVSIVRQLMGVVSTSIANKGILITSSTFTKGAKDLALKDPRLEIINGNSLLHLLNEYLGSDWQDRFYRIIKTCDKKE